MSHSNVDIRREALAAVEAEWTQAARCWDADALAALYSEDAFFSVGNLATAQVVRLFASISLPIWKR